MGRPVDAAGRELPIDVDLIREGRETRIKFVPLSDAVIEAREATAEGPLAAVVPAEEPKEPNLFRSSIRQRRFTTTI